MPDESRFNLGSRPTTYWPSSESAPPYVAGTKRRELATDAEFPNDVGQELSRERLSETTRAAWGKIHPSFMGGEYLPERHDGQAVIARVELESVTGDVIELRAKRSFEVGIEYEVVDEYESEFDFSPRHSEKPLTLGEVIGLLDGVRHVDADPALGTGLTSYYRRLNFSEHPVGAESFVTVHSSYYDELEAWYVEEAQEWIQPRLPRPETAPQKPQPLAPPHPGWPGGATGWIDSDMLPPMPPDPYVRVPSNTPQGESAGQTGNLASELSLRRKNPSKLGGEESHMFDEITVHTKAGDFVFREMDGTTYDECVVLSTDETGEVNMVELLRWLTVKSSADGKVADPAQLHRLPYSVRNQVLAEVNDLYFPE